MSDRPYNKAESLIETAIQCLDWAEENKSNCHIDELETIECFWENAEGMEFSTEENLLAVCQKLINKVHELSNFINKNMDVGKCYPDGGPALATTSE